MPVMVVTENYRLVDVTPVDCNAHVSVVQGYTAGIFRADQAIQGKQGH
jgi:hypothetical protein